MTIRLSVLAIALSASSVCGQDTTLVNSRSLAIFNEASSIEVDPAGRIYVTDSAEHVVRIMSREGDDIFVLGGPGAGEGEFDEPLGVDPTNGLVIVVADAGNNRLQRFTRTFQLIESIPLYGKGPDPVGSGVRSRPELAVRAGSEPGRPIAVVVGDANEIFVLDESRSAVAHFDSSRRLKGFVGSAGDYGRLLDPIDASLLGESLAVADRGLRSIVIFDQFGGYVTELGGGMLEDLSGLFSTDDILIVAYGTRVAIFDAAGTRLADVGVHSREPIRDVAVNGDDLLVLTRRELLAFRLPDLPSVAPRQNRIPD
ncbi:MAG: NHL repeat-containing protein [Rhodothermia bacterium]|nr:NHL repeat-containing protein [Rhodothermia bacterium]